jgi:penicillin-binding protein 1A
MLRFTFYSLLACFIAGIVAVLAVVGIFMPQLPLIDEIREVKLETPLRVYTREGELIDEFGEKRRIPVTFDETPENLVNALIAAEDDRFFSHPGVDWQGILRAVMELARTGEKNQGGSTITMQVARIYYLTAEKTYTRKIKEIMLALKIERELSKQEILALYMNKIFLGHRAYGVGAAAQVYYGMDLEELRLEQLAMIAGLPKAPSTMNPVSNPKRALERRGYVLDRMLTVGFINAEQHSSANAAPITARRHQLKPEVSAPHVAEMVRSEMVRRYGVSVTTLGYQVFTTLDGRLQKHANEVVRNSLLGYDRRHGYRQAEHHYELADDADEEQWQTLLNGFNTVADLIPALVVAVEEQSIAAYANEIGVVSIAWDDIKWACKYISAGRCGATPKRAADVVQMGDVIRILEVAVEDSKETPAADVQEVDSEPMVSEPTPSPQKKWVLTQIPKIEGALVSLNPEDGAVRSLVGGFNFSRSKFNRVTQAKRQPGSNFKPFIYSAALEKDYSPASMVNDSPIVFDAPGQQDTWRPENYEGKNYGPTRLRVALAKSRNLVSVRLLRNVGIERALAHISNFGFQIDQLPHNLSLSLGSGVVLPIEVARGYAVFANGGYLIDPHFIERIASSDGELVLRVAPLRACNECERSSLLGDEEPESIEDLQELAEQEDERGLAPRTVSAANAWLMTSMLQGAIQRGTGAKAWREFKRKDLAGKTGTTNEQRDAWFSGFNAEVVTTVWVGFDQVQPLGKNETGAQAALPMWIDYMRAVLDDMPESTLEQPSTVVTVRIDPQTGRRARSGTPGAVFEHFQHGNLPEHAEGPLNYEFGYELERGIGTTESGPAAEQLF